MEVSTEHFDVQEHLPWSGGSVSKSPHLKKSFDPTSISQAKEFSQKKKTKKQKKKIAALKKAIQDNRESRY